RDGIAEEAKRQAKLLDKGEVIQQETRRYDDKTKKSILMRIKGHADDYRFFPDPDIPPLHINENWKERIRQEIPELPDARRARYIKEMGLPAYDAQVLTATKEMADFFEETVELGADVKQASNWLMGELLGYMNKHLKEIQELPIKPRELAKMIELIKDGTISSKIAKDVFTYLVEEGGDPEAYIK